VAGDRLSLLIALADLGHKAANPRLEAGGYPVCVLLNGMNGMPALGRMMTDEQVAEVVNYVRTHFGNSYVDRVTAEEVKAVR